VAGLSPPLFLQLKIGDQKHVVSDNLLRLFILFRYRGVYWWFSIPRLGLCKNARAVKDTDNACANN
jgi:hypothetical protein